jgi:hypothetical protein
MDESFESKYKNRLYSLLENKKITSEQLDHFIKRGITVIYPSRDFGLKSLGNVLPEIVIGASSSYINKMKVPYQATSYLAANTRSDGKGFYIYKIPRRSAGGILLLTGGKRRIGDNVFASTHRILIGFKAIIVSALNLIVNKNKILNWQFFGNHIKDSYSDIYEDLIKLQKIIGGYSPFHYVVIARSERTFRTLRVAEEYQKNRISVLDPSNNIKVIFVTTQNGYDYASKIIPESDLINYIVTGKEFDIYNGMVHLRCKHNIDIILNDGGRQMSNGIRDAGLLGEERITLEPYPGNKIISGVWKLDPTSILGMSGMGLDGNEVYGTIMIHSTKIGEESANVYVYPLKSGLSQSQK